MILKENLKTGKQKITINMKFLKTFEGMYYSDEMKKTIEDILVELRDEGFK
jgi:hypothetical protein